MNAVFVLTLSAALVSAAPESPRKEPQRRAFRVCADPNNLPFSNEAGEGFENELAELFARELHADLQYTWFPQRRGFIRQTLKAKRCDVIMGVPVNLEMVETTRPYYRSSYVFVYGPKAPRAKSLDAPELRSLKIGVTLVGEDGANPPPVLALGQRGLLANVRGYIVYGDYRKESPPAEVVRAVSRGEVDLAIAWGPLAGYYAQRASPKLEIAPVPASEAPKGQTFVFEIGLGVRHGDDALKAELERVLVKRRKEIDAILKKYGVPRV